jgi:hypothetical protein
MMPRDILDRSRQIPRRARGVKRGFFRKIEGFLPYLALDEQNEAGYRDLRSRLSHLGQGLTQKVGNVEIAARDRFVEHRRHPR